MGIMPEMTELDFIILSEKMLWQKLPGLEGKTADSVEALKSILPDEMKDVRALERRDSEKFVRYAMQDKNRYDLLVAYACDYCNQIIIGMPALEKIDTMAPLTGERSVYYSCTNPNCRQTIKNWQWEVS